MALLPTGPQGTLYPLILLDTHLVSRSDIGDQLLLSLLRGCDEVAGQ